MQPKQLAIIIGSAKCGTTYLFNLLAGHPQVAPSKIKEPEFFTANYKNGFEWYFNLFNFNPDCHKVALEASVGYTKYPTLNCPAKLIQQSGIPVKLIYIMRDPFERIESHYNHGQAERWESISQGITGTHFTNTSKYAMQLDKYYEIFGENEILLLNFQDLKSDEAKVIENVHQFLDLTSCVSSEGAKQAKKLTNKKNQTAGKRIESSLLHGLKKASFAKKMYRRLLSHDLRTFLNSLLSREMTTANKRFLSSEEKDFIFSTLQDDLTRLSKVYGFDIGRWAISSFFEERRLVSSDK